MKARGQLRAWLVLARASNLPTVWSNCISGCWLGGWNSWPTVLLVCAAGSLFYIGGMLLNDLCDVAFDRQYKPDRPIVAGAVTPRAVGVGAIVLPLTGLLLALAIKPNVLLWGAILVFVITAYDILHKRIAWAPLLMATCRFLLYLLAAAAGVLGLTPRALGFALALALYVVGLSYLARGESKVRRTSNFWLLLLFVPVVAGFYFDSLPLALLCVLP